MLYEVITAEKDTLHVNEYLLGKKVGDKIEFEYNEKDDAINIKRFINNSDSCLSEAYVYGKLRFRTLLINGERKYLKAYFNDGKIKAEGFFSNNEMVSLIEYDSLNNIVNFNSNFDFYAKNDSVVIIDFHTTNNCVENKILDYGFFKITEKRDTIKITKELYLEHTVNNGKGIIKVPSKNSGAYFIKIGYIAIKEYQESYGVCDLNYNILKNGHIICNSSGVITSYSIHYTKLYELLPDTKSSSFSYSNVMVAENVPVDLIVFSTHCV